MFDNLMPVSLIAAYATFLLFSFYQTLHFKNFQGASEAFGCVLAIYTSAAWLGGLAFLVYYGWAVKWWLPVALFFIGHAVGLPLIAVEGVISRSLRRRYFWVSELEYTPLFISLLGFPVIPAAAWLMVSSLPEV